MTVEVDNIPALWTAFRMRWSERDVRMDLIDSVVKGDLKVLGLDDDTLESRSPNLVQVALEDTAEAASLVPTVRVIPSAGTQTAERKAELMEQRAISYLDMSQIEMLEIKSLLDLAAFGMFSWVVLPDPESGSPVIEWRDPRTCLPEPGWTPLSQPQRAMFARDLYLSQLPAEWQSKILSRIEIKEKRDRSHYDDPRVTVVEVFESDYITTAALYQASSGKRLGAYDLTWHPVLLERVPTPGGICPVVIGQRPTLDGEPRGQFDQVVGVMTAHIRLMAMVLDYSDQAVYSDVWVKDLIGEMPYGGGAVIQLGPQGAIGRVQPAVSSLQVQQELDQLVNNIHLGGRWPKTRPGEIDQAIASAKFVEATAGMMNTVIRTMHLVMKRALEQALRVCFKQDVEVGDDRTIAGVLRNQQFLYEGRKSDIDLRARVKVDYGIGLGRDPAQTMVLGIQGMQTGMFSKEYVQENFEGLTDVARERQRIDVEQLRDMAMAQLLQGLQEKSIPAQALIEIARKRKNGSDIFDLFEEFVIRPQQAAEEQMLQPGLGGDPMMPGMTDPAAMSPGGMPPPGAPPPEALLAGLMGGGGPPAPGGPAGPPQGPETIGRLSVPLGGGGFAGTQSRG